MVTEEELKDRISKRVDLRTFYQKEGNKEGVQGINERIDELIWVLGGEGEA